MEIQASGEIDRPVSDVFHFYADQHVENHPRWDPDVMLYATSDEPIGAGTVIKREVKRGDDVVQGEMTVTEFERDKVFAVDIRDGPSQVTGRITFEPMAPERTLLTINVDSPAVDDEEVGKMIEGLMQRSVQNIKNLVEGA